MSYRVLPDAHAESLEAALWYEDRGLKGRFRPPRPTPGTPGLTGVYD